MRFMRYVMLLFLAMAFMSQPRLAGAKPTSGIKLKIKSLAAKKVKAQCKACKVEVQCKWISPVLANKPASSIRGLQFIQPGLPSGYVTASVMFGKKGAIQHANAQLHISIRQKVAVANSTINRGQKIDKKDVLWQWKITSKLRRQPFVNSESIVHKTAIRIIQEGHIIYANDVTGRETIQPGDHVVMIYNEDGMDIHIQCIAREAKGLGQTIRLYSKQTGRTYRAKIKSEHKIIWQRTL